MWHFLIKIICVNDIFFYGIWVFEIRVPYQTQFHKLEFQKGGKLLNISQIVVFGEIWWCKKVFGDVIFLNISNYLSNKKVFGDVTLIKITLGEI